MTVTTTPLRSGFTSFTYTLAGNTFYHKSFDTASILPRHADSCENGSEAQVFVSLGNIR
jgi:hypothetical protein